MYLSRITLRPDAASQPGFWSLAEDDYRGHQEVWRLFADDPDRRRDFLYRVDRVPGGVRVFTLSERQPRDDRGLWCIRTQEFRPVLRSGDRLRFSLRANPVVTRDGSRHDVVMEAKRKLQEQGVPRSEWPTQAELAQEAAGAWLEARAPKHGFTLDGVRVDAHTVRSFSRRRGKTVRLATCDFEGLLTVTDPEPFQALLAAGIGPAKGFGCGLLLVARAGRS